MTAGDDDERQARDAQAAGSVRDEGDDRRPRARRHARQVGERGAGDGHVARKAGAGRTENRSELARIADALERIATVAEALAPRPRRRREAPAAIEVSDADRAAARAIARKMGFYVREEKR